MPHIPRPLTVVILIAAACCVAGATVGLAQSNPATIAQQSAAVPPMHTLAPNAGDQQAIVEYGGGAGVLIHTPVTGIFPGGISTRPNINNPVANDPAAAQRGMAYFNAFNCVGCHAANGGGGMGPALSNRFFQYGGEPANIYLTIVQGRPHGMPSWGGVLPDPVIWDLVAYVEQISRAPITQWGTTVSRDSPDIEQVPAEFEISANPWAHTEKFSHGQNPSGTK